MRGIRTLLLALLLGTPIGGSAAVVISEIAWMGTHASANHEWIELHNTGATTVALDGWRLVAVDGTPSITLSGSIAAGGYFLLERTSDDSVPGIPADQIYTGALGNSGEILELYDASARLIDRVDSGENWSIGGDNATKDTAQRIGSRWVTGRPTPRTPNTAVATEPAADAESTSATAAMQTNILYGTPEVPRARVARVVDPLFSVTAGEDKRATARVPLTLSARAYSGSRELLGDAFVWNMGDGTVREGRTIKHVYQHTGTYVVAVSAISDLFREQRQAVDTIVVTVVEPAVSISEVTDTYIALTNTGDTTLDLSGMSIVAGALSATLPPHTYVQGNTSVKLMRTALALPPRPLDPVLVLQAEGYVLARHPPLGASVSAPAPAPRAAAASLARLTTASAAASEAGPQAAAHIEDEHVPVATARLRHPAQVEASAATASPSPNLLVWLLALCGIVASASAIVLSKRNTDSTLATEGVAETASGQTLPDASEFTIIEDDAPPDPEKPY